MRRTGRGGSVKFLLLLLVVLLAPSAPASVVESAGNEMCIVTTDEMVVPGLSVTHDGVVYGVCCRGCVRDFRKAPSRYVRAWQLQQVAAQSEPVHAHDDAANSDRHEAKPGAAIEGVKSVDDTDDQAGEGSDDHTEQDSHDHDTHRGQSGVWAVIAYLGRFHIVLVHFPVALLMLAAGLAWVHVVRPAVTGVLNAALVCTHVGTASALIATLFGWATWTSASYPGNETILLTHQMAGTSVAVLALASSIFVGRSLISPARPRGWLWTVSATAVLVAIAGHFGGSLIYGGDYFLP